ncbi:MAG: molybdopterin-synthase adenylyltransferase MoeB [Pseudomonadota bacterium]
MTPDEIERYARHLVLRDVGGPGQAKLKAARVVVVGAGGLGSPVITYLAAAGVGTVVVVDDDGVSLSNLQRQILHGTPDVGLPKTDSAEAAVGRLNPHVRIVKEAMRLSADNAARLVAGANVVVDGVDNAATRAVLARACIDARVPLVSGAVAGFSGQVTTFAPNEDGPGYSDLYPDPTPYDLQEECAVAGILGVVTGVIGTLQANEALKIILGVGEPLYGRLLLFDARAASFDVIGYGR